MEEEGDPFGDMDLPVGAQIYDAPDLLGDSVSGVPPLETPAEIPLSEPDSDAVSAESVAVQEPVPSPGDSWARFEPAPAAPPAEPEATPEPALETEESVASFADEAPVPIADDLEEAHRLATEPPVSRGIVHPATSGSEVGAVAGVICAVAGVICAVRSPRGSRKKRYHAPTASTAITTTASAAPRETRHAVLPNAARAAG